MNVPAEECVLGCGRHRGKSFRHVAERDPRYCQWVLSLPNPTDDLLRFSTWLQGQGYDARDVLRPGSGGGRSGSVVPWLLLAGLPQGGRTSVDDELRAFAVFVSATDHERRERLELRTAVQSLVRRHVCAAATAKLVGAAAAGLDTVDVPCEIVIERDADGPEPTEPLEALRMALCLLGVPCERIEPTSSCGAPGLRLFPLEDSAAAIVRFASDGTARGLAAAVAAAVDASGACGEARRVTALCALAVLRRMKVLSVEAVLVLLAGWMAERPTDSASCGMMLRDFIRFYAEFDWVHRSVCVGGSESCISDKQAGGQTVWIGYRGENLAAGVSAVRLKAQFCYASGVVQQCDACAVSRRTPFLANLVSHNDLWARYEGLLKAKQPPEPSQTPPDPSLARWTRFMPSRWRASEPDAEEGISLELATTVLENIADFLSDPANAVHSVVLRMEAGKAASTTQRCALALTVLSRAVAMHKTFAITGETAKRLERFAGDVPRLARALVPHRDHPDVSRQRNRMLESGGLDVVAAVCEVIVASGDDSEVI